MYKIEFRRSLDREQEQPSKARFSQGLENPEDLIKRISFGGWLRQLAVASTVLIDIRRYPVETVSLLPKMCNESVIFTTKKTDFRRKFVRLCWPIKHGRVCSTCHAWLLSLPIRAHAIVSGDYYRVRSIMKRYHSSPRGGRDGWMDERALCIAHHQDAEKSRDGPSLGSTGELKYSHAEEWKMKNVCQWWYL